MADISVNMFCNKFQECLLLHFWKLFIRKPVPNCGSLLVCSACNKGHYSSKICILISIGNRGSYDDFPQTAVAIIFKEYANWPGQLTKWQNFW